MRAWAGKQTVAHAQNRNHRVCTEMNFVQFAAHLNGFSDRSHIQIAGKCARLRLENSMYVHIC